MTTLFVTILSILAIMLLGVLGYIIVQYRRVSFQIGRLVDTNQEEVDAIVKSYDHINIYAFDFPRSMEKLSHDDLYNATHAIFRVFKSVDYKNYDHRNFEKDWHSWQMGLLLMLYKRDEEFFIPKPETVFREDVLELDIVYLKKRVHDILVRYRDEVNIKSDRNHLSEDKRWSGQDISIIFYFLSQYKNIKIDNQV